MNIELLHVWDRVKNAIVSNWLDSPNYHREKSLIEANAYMRGYNQGLQDAAASAEAAMQSIEALPVGDIPPVVPNPKVRGGAQPSDVVKTGGQDHA